MSLDITQIRSDFPLLSQPQGEYPLSYLDSTNTSLTPTAVTKAMDEYYHQYNANVHRAVYQLSEKATAKMDEARVNVQQFVNAPSSEEIIFTRNGTEAINLVVQSWGKENLKKEDVVVLSMMEHHSNIVPWQLLQKDIGFDIIFLDLTKEGRLDLDQYQKVLDQNNVKMVSIVHQSNVLGTVNPIKEMAALAHQHEALFMADACQSVPHMKVDVQDLGVDFMAVTGHKMLGPTGSGFLYGKKKILESMPPFLGGGDMIRSVTCKESTWNVLPYKFEAGTPNIAGVIGLGAAIDCLNKVGIENIHNYEQELGKYCLDQLKVIPGVSLYGPQEMKDRGATFSFALEGIHPHDLASILSDRGVCIRAGHHCAQPLMEYLKVPATARASLYIYNTFEEIDRLVEGIEEAKKIFKV